MIDRPAQLCSPGPKIRFAAGILQVAPLTLVRGASRTVARVGLDHSAAAEGSPRRVGAAGTEGGEGGVGGGGGDGNANSAESGAAAAAGSGTGVAGATGATRVH